VYYKVLDDARVTSIQKWVQNYRAEYHDNRSTPVCLHKRYSSDYTAVNFMATVLSERIRSLTL